MSPRHPRHTAHAVAAAAALALAFLAATTVLGWHDLSSPPVRIIPEEGGLYVEGPEAGGAPHAGSRSYADERGSTCLR